MARASSIYVSTNTRKLSSTSTPQTQALPGREDEMVRNSAGGMTFQLDQWGYLDRFLILGSEAPSYYASAKKLTKLNSANLLACIKADGIKTVDRIVELSLAGRAPKNDPAVFALAMCAVHGNEATIKAAYEALPKVCRIGTHLFQFVSALDELGKWNAAAKRGVAAWYTKRGEDKLALQLLKYQQRDGWAHRDVLRLAHVKPQTEVQSNLFRYVVKGSDGLAEGSVVPQLVNDFEALKGADAKKAIKLIESNDAITWEMIPTELQRDVNVMSALLPGMGITALIRKLGQLTNVGVIAPLSADAKTVIAKLSDKELIKSGRVHPITILNAFNTYKKGHGDKGSLTWKPVQPVVDALNDAFYEAFEFIESTGEGYLIGIDCSGSMWWDTSRVKGMNLTAAEVAAVMALGLAKREPNHWIGAFGTTMKELKITPKMRLDQVLNVMQTSMMGGTDCSLPMTHASTHKMSGVDKFCVYTDNETYAGRAQPVETLARYRKQYNPKAKLIVCGVAATDFTIADPKDPGMLDIVGFDSAAPQLIQSF